MNRLLVRFFAALSILALLIFVNSLVKIGIDKYDPCENLIDYKILDYSQDLSNGLISFNLTMANEGEVIDGFVLSVINDGQIGVAITTVDEPLLVNSTREYSYSFDASNLENKSISKIEVFPLLKNYDLKCPEHILEVNYG